MTQNLQIYIFFFLIYILRVRNVLISQWDFKKPKSLATTKIPFSQFWGHISKELLFKNSVRDIHQKNIQTLRQDLLVFFNS